MIKGHTEECRKTWRAISGGYYCEIHDSFIDWEEDFIDDMKQIWANEGKTCIYCKHLKDIYGSKCVAFPSVIPSPFLTGMERHTKPKYGQKNSIVFSPKISKRPPKTKCPKCGSKKDVIPIVYGYPTAQTMKEAEKGNIKLGGCCISDVDPQWWCKRCKREFGKIRRRKNE
jgi:hypothetical protein